MRDIGKAVEGEYDILRNSKYVLWQSGDTKNNVWIRNLSLNTQEQIKMEVFETIYLRNIWGIRKKRKGEKLENQREMVAWDECS